MKQIFLTGSEGLVVNGHTLVQAEEGGENILLTLPSAEFVRVYLCQDGEQRSERFRTGKSPDVIAHGLFLVDNIPGVEPETLRPFERPSAIVAAPDGELFGEPAPDFPPPRDEDDFPPPSDEDRA